MRLKMRLPKRWVDYSNENPDGPPTYVRASSECPGPLQVSMMEYKSGVVPNPSEDDLRRMSIELGGQRFGELIESWSGECEWGRMGTAVFRSGEWPRTQMWHLSNGKDLVLVTHIFPCEPDLEEVREAQEIVRWITLGPNKPWWKFW